jgi:hypothetical protein
MYPQAPQRTDSSKYVADNKSIPNSSLNDFRQSWGQLNFVVEQPQISEHPQQPQQPQPPNSKQSQQQMNQAPTAAVPPLSTYSPDSSPPKMTKSKSFQSHTRHSKNTNGNTYGIDLGSYSNTPPISPTRSASLNVVKDKVFNNDTESRLPKKEEGYTSLERKSEYSMHEFLSKLQRFDGELMADTGKLQDVKYSYLYSINAESQKVIPVEKENVQKRDSYSLKTSDYDPALKDLRCQSSITLQNQRNYKINTESMNEMFDLLKVTLLESEQVPQNSFQPPKIDDIDPDLGYQNPENIPKRTSSIRHTTLYESAKHQQMNFLQKKSISSDTYSQECRSSSSSSPATKPNISLTTDAQQNTKYVARRKVLPPTPSNGESSMPLTDSSCTKIQIPQGK